MSDHMLERPAVEAVDEGHHPVGDDLLWSESWYFDFAARDGSIGGWIRIGLYPNLDGGTCWYQALVCGPGRPTVAVIRQDVPLPAAGSLEIEASGLWADQVEVEPLTTWRVRCEATARAVADPADLYQARGQGPGGEVGEAVPLAFDLQWATAGEPYHYVLTTRYEIPCVVRGELEVGGEHVAFDGIGQRDHSWAPRDWWAVGWTWTAGGLEDGTRFNGVDVKVPENRAGFGYVQAPTGEVIPAAWPDPTDGSVLSSERLGREGLPDEASVQIGDLDMAIEPLAFAPVPLWGPKGELSRFHRALCRFTADDGRAGVGWTEWNQPQPQLR